MKHENQKFKILLIRDWLDETDELHPLTVSDIIERLKREDIHAERKSVADDLLTLSEYGLDIESQAVGKKKGYYLASRPFETAELKMLVDSVQAARFPGAGVASVASVGTAGSSVGAVGAAALQPASSARASRAASTRKKLFLYGMINSSLSVRIFSIVFPIP